MHLQQCKLLNEQHIMRRQRKIVLLLIQLLLSSMLFGQTNIKHNLPIKKYTNNPVMLHTFINDNYIFNIYIYLISKLFAM